jgi:hypothetical protein
VPRAANSAIEVVFALVTKAGPASKGAVPPPLKAGLHMVLNDWYDAFYDGPGKGITVTTGDGPDGVFGQALGLEDSAAQFRAG